MRVCKLVRQQADRPEIYCEGTAIKNVFRSKYLGSIFAADAKYYYDVKARIAQAYTRCGQLKHVLDAEKLPTTLKV